MSSWANRHIPRKRDLTQIPEPFRPEIIPRAARPEVILSETFQVKETNEVIYPDFSDSSFSAIFASSNSGSHSSSNRNTSDSIADRRAYPIKKIEPFLSPSATELRYQGKSYVFVILRHIGITRDNDLWITSYNAIRKFYTNKVIIIDDNSAINTVNGRLTNTEIIMSEWNGAGEILPYYYFFHNKWADRMIFVHDSMFLYRPFTDAELDAPAIFHWHFSKIDAADKDRMKTYLSLLSNKEALMAYLDQPWKGCFGGTMIISYEIVEALEAQYHFFTKLVIAIRNRKDRQIFERLIGLVLHCDGVVQEDHCSNFGDILRYPRAFEADHQSADTASYNIKQKNYNTAILKVWRGR
jgi:hypothetical protein